MSAMPRKRKQNLIEDVRLHDLRHTGTYAGQSGANAFLVRDLGQCLAAQRRRSARARQPRCFAPILLQKSFCIVDYKIPGPQARFSRKHVGGHISHRFSGVLAQIAAIAACTPRTTLKRTALRALAHAGIVALAGAGVVFLTREASPQTSIETAPNASALTAAILVPRGSERPSFDCAKAKTAAARLICADAELARLDSGLGAAFRKRKAQLSVADQSAFVADELAWIKDRNTRCGLAGKDGAAIEVLATSKPCVTNAIRERIAYLVQIHTTTGPETAPSESSASADEPNDFKFSPECEEAVRRSEREAKRSGPKDFDTLFPECVERERLAWIARIPFSEKKEPSKPSRMQGRVDEPTCDSRPQNGTTCISLEVQTRFGELTVLRNANECCGDKINYRGHETRLELQPGTAFVSLFGVYRVKEGDIVVLEQSAGGSGTADYYSIYLAAEDQIIDLTPSDFNSWLAGRFGIQVTQNGDEIDFDLGYEKRRRKGAIYRNGGLSVFFTVRMPDDVLPKDHCSAVLAMVARCARAERCEDDIELYGGMAGERYVTTLDDMPVFESGKFDRICREACATRTYSAAQTTRVLCGYPVPRSDTRAAKEEPSQTPESPSIPEHHVFAYGTGFFVAKDGQALTNAHVVDGCHGVLVRFGGKEMAAQVVARDGRNDLALLATDLQPLNVASWRPLIRQGEDIVVYGFPLPGVLAAGGNVAEGIVTALAGLGNDSRYMQISAPVQPGNSGGPLFDRNGNVVGIVVAKLDALKVAAAIGDIPQNINFAIKASVATAFLDAQRVSHAEKADNPALSTPDIAERAKALTMQVVCVQ